MTIERDLMQPACRYISEVLASDATPSEKHIARTIMHLLPLDAALAAPVAPALDTSHILLDAVLGDNDVIEVHAKSAAPVAPGSLRDKAYPMAAPVAPAIPPGYVLCPVEWLIDMRTRINTLATLSIKSERILHGIAIKRDIADMMNSGQKSAPADLADEPIVDGWRLMGGFPPAHAPATIAEPVAQVHACENTPSARLEWASVAAAHNARPGPLYSHAAPVAPALVPLTDVELRAIVQRLADTVGASLTTVARAVEAAHGVKP